MMKRVLSFILCMVMLFALLPAAAFADDSTAVKDIYIDGMVEPKDGLNVDPSQRPKAALSPFGGETEPETLKLSWEWSIYDEDRNAWPYYDDGEFTFKATNYYCAELTVTLPADKTIPTKTVDGEKYYSGNVWVNGEKVSGDNVYAYPKNGKLVIELVYAIRTADESKIISKISYENVNLKAYVGTKVSDFKIPQPVDKTGLGTQYYCFVKLNQKEQIVALRLSNSTLWSDILGLSDEEIDYVTAGFGSTFEKDYTYVLMILEQRKPDYVFSLESVDIEMTTADGLYQKVPSEVGDADKYVLVNVGLETVVVSKLSKPVITLSDSSGRIKVKWSAVTGASKYEVYRSDDNKNFSKIKTTTSTSYTDTDSGNGTTYYYKVRALNNGGSKTVYSSYSSVKSFCILKAAYISSCKNASSGITLKWSKVAGADKIYIYRSDDGETYTKIASATGTSYTDKTVKSGSSYYYRIQASKGSGDAEMLSKESSSVHPTYLAAPSIKVEKADKGVTVSWKAIEGADSYAVTRYADDKNLGRTEIVTGTSYTDPKGNETLYHYKVCAQKQAPEDYGEDQIVSAYSAVKTSAAFRYPTVTAKLSGTSVKLSWKASGAEKYEIYRSTDGGKTYKLLKSVTGLSFTDEGLTKGSTYYYKVRSIIKDGSSTVKSDFCAPFSVKVLKAPTVTLTKSDGKVTLSWKAVSGAAKYKVYRSTDNKSFKLLTTTSKLSYTNSSVTSGTKYYYKVRAVDAAGGLGAYSSVKNGVPIATPTLTATLSGTSVKLSWAKVTGATKYEIYRSTDGGETYKLLKSVTGTSYTNESLTKGNTYYYKVRAVKVSGSTSYTGSYSATQSVKVLKAPSITVKVNNELYTEKSISLSWKAISGAEKYQVYRSTDNKSFKRVATTSKLSYTDTKANSGTKYYYKVRAVDTAGGLGAYSSVKNGIILAEPIIKYDGKKITWDALKGATKYEVYVCKDLMEGGNELLKTTTSCSVSVKSGQGYGYRVLAVYTIDGKTYKSPLSNSIIT